MLSDLRLAVRSHLRSAGTSTVAVLVLGLGIAGATLVFGFVRALLFEPLEFRDPEAWVQIFGVDRELGTDRQRLVETEVQAILDHTDGFSEIVHARNTGKSVTDAPRPLNPLMREVSVGWFEMTGARPELGRVFTREEIEGEHRVVVLSWGLWQSHLGGDPDAVGRTIELEHEPWEIVGVLPASYRNDLFPSLPVLWMPMPRHDPTRPAARSRHIVVARPLGDAAAVERQLDRVVAELTRADPDRWSTRAFRALPVRDAMVETFRPGLLVLIAAVGLVLLISCANVAHLLLARALGRTEELLLRRALGARTGHLVRMLFTESLLLALVAGGLALLVVSWSVDPLLALGPNNLTSIPFLHSVAFDPEVFLFGLALSVATAFLAGLLPLLRLLRPGQRLLSGRRTTRSRDDGRLRRALVVSEIALSVTLVAGAGLALRSFEHLRDLPLGIEPDDAVVFRTGARGPGFEDPEGWKRFRREVRRELGTLPGIEAVGAAQFLPMFANGGLAQAISLEGADGPTSRSVQAVLFPATPGYFAAAGQKLLDGRPFEERDDGDSEPVAVVSQRVARQLTSEPLVGRTLRLGPDRVVRVVGIAEDLRGTVDDPSPPPLVFLPLAQNPIPNMTYLLRGERMPEEILRAIEDRVWSVTREVPVFGFSTAPDLVRDLEWRPRFLSQLLTGFALLALALASSGLFAILSAAVTERRAEMGIRMALGADRTRLLMLVESEAMRLALAGTTLGLLGALGLGRILAGELQGVGSSDPLTLVGTGVVLLVVSVVAAWAPAWRAARLDPARALRSN